MAAGARGIEHAIAVAFAKSGAEVHVVDYHEPSLDALNNAHPDIYTSCADVAIETEVESVCGNRRIGKLRWYRWTHRLIRKH